jgi:Ketopantoate reductase PanE/ApbA
MSEVTVNNTMQPSVLIVGAGALGLVTGYHLSLAGASVMFFVRPARLAAMRSPQLLYCYDDGQLKEYKDYRAVSTIAEIAAQRFDYVLVTFDGATCRSIEGVQLLRELADAIRPTAAQLIICGVGVGLRDHYLQVTQLPEERLMEGTLGSLSHQVPGANLPIHSPTDRDKLARASMAYHHFPNKLGFNIASRPAKAAREFAALYNRCGISRCGVLNVNLNTIMGNAFFPLTAVSEMAGWPDAATLAANKPLWSMCVQAQKEIIGLPQHGLVGKLVRLLVSEKMLYKLVSKLEKESLPLDFHAFNRFHHGAKVQAQDIQVMENCVKSGESQGQPMSSLNELLRQYKTHRLQQTGA